MSVESDLWDLTASSIGDLGLTLGATAVTVLKRKVPVLGEGLDLPALPVVLVCPAEKPGKDVWFDTGRGSPPRARRLRERAFHVLVLSASNRDATKSGTGNAETYSEWTEKIANLFVDPRAVGADDLADYETLLRVRYTPEVNYDRRAFGLNYDLILAATVTYDSVEPVGG